MTTGLKLLETAGGQSVERHLFSPVLGRRGQIVEGVVSLCDSTEEDGDHT